MGYFFDDDKGKIIPRTLLWTNPAPNSNFAAQTLNIDMSGYDCVEIELSQGELERLPVGVTEYDRHSITLQTVNAQLNRIGIQMRTLTVTGPNQILIGDAYSISSSDFTTRTYNNLLVPYKIYGIKF